jgi:hypothetical protein
MSRWFRHYAGMCRDEKLVSVAIKSKQPIERVVWVYGAILESAAEIDDNGRYQLDAAEVAYFLRADEADILAIEGELCSAERTNNFYVVAWSKRQFASDRSKQRVATYRERKRSAGSQAYSIEASRKDEVTLQKRHCNSPEAETETEKKEVVLRASASARDLDYLERQCREAAEVVYSPAAGLCNLSPIIRCLDAGASLEADILPILRGMRYRQIKTWSYATQAIMDAKATREAPAPQGRATGPPQANRIPKGHEQASKLRLIIERTENEHRERQANREAYPQLAASQHLK